MHRHRLSSHALHAALLLAMGAASGHAGAAANSASVQLLPVEVTAPQFAGWRSTGAESLVQGFVQADAAGNLTVGCYLYDMALGTELVPQNSLLREFIGQ